MQNHFLKIRLTTEKPVVFHWRKIYVPNWTLAMKMETATRCQIGSKSHTLRGAPASVTRADPYQRFHSFRSTFPSQNYRIKIDKNPKKSLHFRL